MIKITFPTATPGSKANPVAAGLAVLVLNAVLCQTVAAVTVDLGTASIFAVLAGAGITNTGPTTITGDVGTFPTAAITGFGSVTLIGTNQNDNAVTQLAKLDLVAAYNDAAVRPPSVIYPGGFDLVGLTLVPGVYQDTSSLFLSGTVTLDAQGDPEAVWIFQAGSSLITASGSQVLLTNGAQACHVFWQVGSSATLGTDTDFAGSILALTSITVNTGATVDGRLLAQNGAVTLDNNTMAVPVCLTVPEPGSTGLLVSGLTVLGAFRRRRGN